MPGPRHRGDADIMQIRYHNIHETRSFVATVLGNEVRMGRSADCDIVLRSPYVSPEAALLRRDGSGWELHVGNENGCSHGSAAFVAGTRVRLRPHDTFRLFPFEFTLDPDDSSDPTDDDIWNALEERALELVRQIHVELLERMNLAAVPPDELTGEFLLRLERNLEVIARECGVTSDDNRDLVRHLAGHCVRSELIDQTLRYVRNDRESVLAADARWSVLHSANPTRERELTRLQRRVAGLLSLADEQMLTERMRQIDTGFRSAWKQAGDAVLSESLLYFCLRQLKKQVKDIVYGYGPLEDMLRLPTITEIMVVGSDRIFVERDGLIENSGRRFVSDDVTQAVIDRIVSRVGRRIDKSEPIADARLADGSRVNAVIGPVALDGPLLTVRKFPLSRLTMDALTHGTGSVTPAAAAFLKACVIARKNILISGGTGTGKTTLLNCLADFIPDRERIVTIEDTAELRIPKRHVARMETKNANIEGTGQYEIADLVRNALRMRPDRVIVGECRGREALWMLQAMNTGHDGCLTTIHANSCRDVIARLEVMVQSAADLPVQSIHQQIASAVDLVVQLDRRRDGTRVVSEIAEILPPRRSGSAIGIRRMFTRDTDEQLTPTGHLPTFMPQLLHEELLDLESFYPAGADGPRVGRSTTARGSRHHRLPGTREPDGTA